MVRPCPNRAAGTVRIRGSSAWSRSTGFTETTHSPHFRHTVTGYTEPPSRMTSSRRAGAPRRLVALIAAITIVPLAVFLWLGVRLLDQDRRLERQQARERLQTASDLVVATLQRAAASTDQKLASGAGDWPDGAVAVTFRDNRIDVSPPRRTAFLPM